MSQRILDQSDILDMEKRYRVNFINSLSGFKSLNLAASINPDTQTTNLAPVSSVIHVGANPPLMGMLMRPDSVPRDTLENIRSGKYWTLNHVNEEFFEKAHQCSARYPSDVSEFDETLLTEEYKNFPAPFVKEARIKIGLKLEESFDLKSNGTHFLVGKVLTVILPEDIVEEDGFLNLEKAGTLTVSGLDSYHSTKKLSRLKYAKA